jgi:hypothetical protein
MRTTGPQTLYTDDGIACGEEVCDWCGVNYYTRPAMNWCFQMGAGNDNEPVGDNGFRLYPQVSGVQSRRVGLNQEEVGGRPELHRT